MKNSRSHSNFVLINNDRGTQRELLWKTKHKRDASTAFTFKDNLTYMGKKHLISNLNEQRIPKSESCKRIKQFTINQKNRVFSSQIKQNSITKISQYTYANPQRNEQRNIKTSISTRTNIMSKDVQLNELNFKVLQGLSRKSKIIGVLSMRRFGLRYKINYCFIEFNKNYTNQQMIDRIMQQMKQFRAIKKRPYLFHMNGEPLNNLNLELSRRQYVIIADISPKMNLEFQAQLHLFQQSNKLQENIRICQKSYNFPQQQKEDINNAGQQIYQWQRIKNIKQYVDKIVQNPENILKAYPKQNKTSFNKFINEQFKQQQSKKQNNKNPIFQTISHYKDQTQNQQLLNQVSDKLESFPKIKNKHQYKKYPIENMLEKIRRQVDLKDIITQKYDVPISEKQFLKSLDKKNITLSQQNIPYMINKYGINRSQVHNLYCLYKSLQKISAMRRGPQNYAKIYNLGIDRQTFDEGMKGLQINPGDQVIRNICYFTDFISWEQFIKIISISLRKTPQQKLQAILQSIGGSSNGYLTELQIDIMVGSSLSKIFNQDQPQLKKYFVSVVMKQLDPLDDKKIAIQFLKQRILKQQNQQMDIVSFLMLNS